MYLLNGSQGKVLRSMASCYLNEYQSKVCFTLLVTGRSKAVDVSRRSGVPQSKIYFVLESLEDRGLVKVDGTPKWYTPTDFSKFLRRVVRSKESEIASIRKFGVEVEKIVATMRPLATSYRRYRIFEPKYRRRSV